MYDSADDMTCLRAFVAAGSHEAFAAIAARRVDMVYSAALRQLGGDPHLAEDVTQLVFVALARKARALVNRPNLMLSAWLLSATRLVALDARRRAARRRKHEERAAQMHKEQTDLPDQRTWSEVRPKLDAALAKLSERDRRAILLRYFENRSMQEIAAAMGVSEEAARQRVWRAMERLRERFGPKGAAGSISAASLGSMLAAHVVHSAPPLLAAAATHAALATGASGAALPLALKGAIHVMAWTKAQMTAACVGIALLAVGTGTTVMYVRSTSRPQAVVVAPTAVAGATPPGMATPVASIPLTADVRQRFNDAHALSDGRWLRYVQPTQVEERAAYLDSIDRQHMFDHRDTKGVYVFNMSQGQPEFASWSIFGSMQGVLGSVVGLPSYAFEMSAADRNRPMGGDWVMRPGATEDQKMADFQHVLHEQMNLPFHFEKRKVLRDCLIVSGNLNLKPLYDEGKDKVIFLYVGKPPAARPIYNMGIGDLKRFAVHLGEILNEPPVIDDQAPVVTNPPMPRTMSLLWSDRLPKELNAATRAELLKNLAAQTGLTFTTERRLVDTWVTVPDGSTTASIGTTQPAQASRIVQ